MFCVRAAGGFGGSLRSDSLPGRVHPGGAGHEDQPDRGQGAGRLQQRTASWAHLTMCERERKLSHSVIRAMHFNNINIMVNIRLA